MNGNSKKAPSTKQHVVSKKRDPPSVSSSANELRPGWGSGLNAPYSRAVRAVFELSECIQQLCLYWQM